MPFAYLSYRKENTTLILSLSIPILSNCIQAIIARITIYDFAIGKEIFSVVDP